MTEEKELLFMMSLSLVQGVGTERGKTLIDRFGSAENVFKASRTSLASTNGIGETTANAIKNFRDFGRAEREFKFTQKHQVQILDLYHPNYPSRLRQQFDPPLILFQKGGTLLNHQKLVAVIGTRKCSDYGKHMAKNITEDLAHFGCIIVSGLAYGIDVVAHETCNRLGYPNVAILGHGLDFLYPRPHKKIAMEMLELGGSLITEYFTEIKMVPEMFPRRNRIVAGMCDAIVLIESKMKGGAMVTIDIADSYQTDIFAVPGRVGDATSEGSHFLIRKNKAALVTSAEDIIGFMNWRNPSIKSIQLPLISHMEPDEKKLFQLFNSHSVHIEELQLKSEFAVSKLNFILIQLELNGLIRALPGKYYEKI